MLARVPAFEMPYWLALYGMDPSGEIRADLRAAFQTSAWVNTQIPKKKDHTKPSDFMVGAKLKEQHRKQTLRREGREFDKEKFFANLDAWVKK